MKICLPCPGLDHIQRGFESYTRELFEALEHEEEVHLVKSTGTRAPRVHVAPALKRTSPLLRLLPKKLQSDYRRVQIECWTFAISMLPLLFRERFVLIHFSEVPLGEALKWLRKIFRFRYRLLLSNGAPWEPWDCARFDSVHQVSPAHHAACLAHGVPAAGQHLVPYGFNPELYAKPEDFDKAAARKRLGIPEDAFVVLSLAALNMSHKRIDWLIQEFAQIGRESGGYLLLVGNEESETSSLRNIAEEKLEAGHWKMARVPFDQVPELLWASDVMVQCSLDEGFGRTLVEAMLSTTPLLVHPHPTASYLVDSPDSFVDLTQPGELARALGELSGNPAKASRICEKNLAKARQFMWENLRRSYREMYRQVMAKEDASLRDISTSPSSPPA